MTRHDALRPGGELDRFVADEAKKDTFSGNILVSHRNRTVLARSYGMADKARQIPNTPDTIFNLASITKMLTALAIAQHAEGNRLVFNGKVGAYLKGFQPELADHVTVHHLLLHTSGLDDTFPVPGADGWDGLDEIFTGMLAFLKNARPSRIPGTEHVYSNDGYFLLGAIVAALSEKQSYYHYIRDHIFTPAGMRSSDFFTAGQWRQNRRIAHPHSRQNDKWVDWVDTAGGVGLPAAGAFATAQDLVNLANAFQHNTLLGSAFADIIASPKLPRDRANSGYLGYSIAAINHNGQWFNRISGGSPGVSCHLTWFPDTGWVVVVLGNYGEGSTSRLISTKAQDLILS